MYFISPAIVTDCTTDFSGLVSWWPAAGTALDLTGGNNGIELNGVSYMTGKVGQAFVFDGVNDHIRIPDQPNLRIPI